MYLDYLSTDTQQEDSTLTNDLPQVGSSNLRTNNTVVDYTDYNNYVDALGSNNSSGERNIFTDDEDYNLTDLQYTIPLTLTSDTGNGDPNCPDGTVPGGGNTCIPNVNQQPCIQNSITEGDIPPIILEHPPKEPSPNTGKGYNDCLYDGIAKLSYDITGSVSVHVEIVLSLGGSNVTFYPSTTFNGVNLFGPGLTPEIVSSVNIHVPGFKGALAKYFLTGYYTYLSATLGGFNETQAQQLFTLRDSTNSTPVTNHTNDLLNNKNGHTATSSQNPVACENSTTQATEDAITRNSLLLNVPYEFDITSLVSQFATSWAASYIASWEAAHPGEPASLVSYRLSSVDAVNAVSITTNSITVNGQQQLLAAAWMSEETIENNTSQAICHSQPVVQAIRVYSFLPGTSHSTCSVDAFGFCIFGSGSSGNISSWATFNFSWMGNALFISYLNTQGFLIDGVSPLKTNTASYENYCAAGTCDQMATDLVNEGALDPANPIVARALVGATKNTNGTYTCKNTTTTTPPIIAPTPPQDPGTITCGTAITIANYGGRDVYALCSLYIEFVNKLSLDAKVPPAIIAAIFDHESSLIYPSDTDLSLSFPTDSKVFFQTGGACSPYSLLTDASTILSTYTIQAACGIGPGQLTGPSNWQAALGGTGNTALLQSLIGSATVIDTVGDKPGTAPGQPGNFDTSALLSSLLMLNKAGYYVSGTVPTVWGVSLLNAMDLAYSGSCQYSFCDYMSSTVPFLETTYACSAASLAAHDYSNCFDPTYSYNSNQP